MKFSLLLTAGLAFGTIAAFAQTTAPSQSAPAGGTAASSTPAYSKSQPTPTNATTDHMGDPNSQPVSAPLPRPANGAMRNGHKGKLKTNDTPKTAH